MECNLLNTKKSVVATPKTPATPVKMEKTKGTPSKTLIVVILDESGSMQVQKSDVVGGYQNFIEEQKAITEDLARLVLIKFNTTVTVAHAALPIETTPKLTEKNYSPGGGTALYDAVSEGIRITEATVQSDERVLVLIMTDGEENSSKKATQEGVRKLMKEKEDLGNWTFTYIGQNPEAWASSMQQSVGNVRQYNMAHQQSNMAMNSTAVASFRKQMQMRSSNFYNSPN